MRLKVAYKTVKEKMKVGFPDVSESVLSIAATDFGKLITSIPEDFQRYVNADPKEDCESDLLILKGILLKDGRKLVELAKMQSNVVKEGDYLSTNTNELLEKYTVTMNDVKTHLDLLTDVRDEEMYNQWREITSFHQVVGIPRNTFSSLNRDTPRSDRSFAGPDDLDKVFNEYMELALHHLFDEVTKRNLKRKEWGENNEN